MKNGGDAVRRESNDYCLPQVNFSKVTYLVDVAAVRARFGATVHGASG
jgi:hypothetical protein